MIVNRDPEAHHHRRKLLSRGFSQAALVEFEPRIIAKINTLFQQWSALASEKSSIDVYPWVHMLGFDTICTFHPLHVSTILHSDSLHR